MEKYEFGDYFELILISYIVLDFEQCSVMLETALFDSMPKVVEVNSRKINVRWGRFRFLSILDFAMVISFATISSFMSKYSMEYAPIIFILFLLESLYMKT